MGINQFHMRATQDYRSLLSGLDRVADLVGRRLSQPPPSYCTQPPHWTTAASIPSQIYPVEPQLTPLPPLPPLESPFRSTGRLPPESFGLSSSSSGSARNISLSIFLLSNNVWGIRYLTCVLNKPESCSTH